jgi:hypothetical protein
MSEILKELQPKCIKLNRYCILITTQFSDNQVLLTGNKNDIQSKTITSNKILTRCNTKKFTIIVKTMAVQEHEQQHAKVILNGERTEQALNLNIFNAAYQRVE